MKLKLIPVVEIWGKSEGLKTPDKSPNWEYPDVWEMYNKQALQNAGYDVCLQSYVKGSSLYRLSDMNEYNLYTLMKAELNDILESELTMEDVSPFSGGYILDIADEYVLFPQCCADLGDVNSWKTLAQGDVSDFWQGHPMPRISIENEIITFFLKEGEIRENYVNHHPYDVFSFTITDLKEALVICEEELSGIIERMSKINTKYKMGIPSVEKFIYK